MNILFVGNSMGACIKKAYDQHNGFFKKLGNVFFYMTIGDRGPCFTVKNDQLVFFGAVNPDFTPRFFPENTPNLPLSHYDHIIVSGIGRLDGGLSKHDFINELGLVFGFGPKENSITKRLVSAKCYKSMLESALLDQPGVKFLAKLKDSFAGRIFVQPFPLPSSMLKEHPDWLLNKMYDNAEKAHKFNYEIRDNFMRIYCKKLNVELLPYPSIIGNDYFTPQEFMSNVDGLHPYASYGKIVLDQIMDSLCR